MTKIKAILFDLDDTLYNERAFVLSGFKAVAKYLSEKYGIDPDSIYNLLVESIEHYGRGKNFDIVLKKLNLYDKMLVMKLVEIYRTHTPDISLYPDAREILHKLRELSYKLGIITDGDVKAQMNKINALGLRNFFDCIIVTDKYGIDKRKPNPYPYKLALNLLGVSGKEAVYMGDNPYKDFIGAKKLGMLTIRVLRGQYKNVVVSEEYNADYMVKDLREAFRIILSKDKLMR